MSLTSKLSMKGERPLIGRGGAIIKETCRRSKKED
jgi:hypothetical protein